MADTSDINADEGASPAQLLIEACRMNNTDLLASIIEKCTSVESAAKLLNETKTVMGNHVYHEAALRGNWDVIDMLLDQEGFECDPINDRDGDTPLHSVVRWINGSSAQEKEAGTGLVEMMLEAGNDPRVRNKANLKAAELVDPSNKDLKTLLEDSEYMTAHHDDFVDAGDYADVGDDDPTGSNSDSDFDISKKDDHKPAVNGTSE
ncbi:MAG: hypothetical protein M1818_006811 [Claussenomyces sp. TS43310]|nr:MAG: hypothetical protein M1818_006811 [Claussenomyces sp. TS43310]